MDTDRFWNKTNFEVVPLDQQFAHHWGKRNDLFY